MAFITGAECWTSCGGGDWADRVSPARANEYVGRRERATERENRASVERMRDKRRLQVELDDREIRFARSAQSTRPYNRIAVFFESGRNSIGTGLSRGASEKPARESGASLSFPRIRLPFRGATRERPFNVALFSPFYGVKMRPAPTGGDSSRRRQREASGNACRNTKTLSTPLKKMFIVFASMFSAPSTLFQTVSQRALL